MGEILKLPDSTEAKERPVVVVSAAKAFVAACCADGGTKLRLSAEAIERLSCHVRDLLKVAAQTALEDHRRTVLERDLPLNG